MGAKQDIAAEKKAVKVALSESRSRPIGFAALISKDGVVVQTDKKKSVDALKKAAKALGGGTRGAWGEMSTNGSSVTLICDADPASKIDQLVRKYFADRGQSVKVEVKLRAEIEAVEAEAAPQRDAPDAPAPKEQDKPAATTPERKDRLEREEPPAAASEPAEDAAGAAPSAGPDPDDAEDLDDPDDEDDIAAQAGDVQGLLRAAKKKDYFFAWMLGKDAPVLKAHRRRATKKLVLAARQEGASPRGAWGKMRVEGKRVVLTCEEAPPKSLAKKARFALKDIGLSYKVVCVLPSGEVLESDESEDIAEDAAPAADAPAPENEQALTDAEAEAPAPDLSEAMSAKLGAADKVIALFWDAPQDAARLRAIKDAAQGAVRSGDATLAAQHLNQLAQVARELPRAPAERRARSIGALVDMKGDIKNTAREHAHARGYLTDLCKSLVNAANMGDFNAADEKVGQVERALKAAKTPPLSPEELDRTVTALAPQEATATAEYARIATFLKPVLSSEHPEKPAVTKALQSYKDAAAQKNSPGILSAIAKLRQHEATIEDVGPKIGEGGMLQDTMTAETVEYLSQLLATGQGS